MSDPLYNMTDLAKFFGFTMTAEFIRETLGVQPDEQMKRSSMYHSSTVEKITRNLQAHIDGLDTKHLRKVVVPKPPKPEKKVAAPAPSPAAADEDGEVW
jgi:hypothetical protein